MAAINLTPDASFYHALKTNHIDAIYAAARGSALGGDSPVWGAPPVPPGTPSTQTGWPHRYFIERPIANIHGVGCLSRKCRAPQTCLCAEAWETAAI